ncbi:hypothetical protein BDY19DRAFT_232987 [Irpex rosettiformis]|uniref:Uncharacterized protein n=1 Tax=Irpex rosettiformis TaxID=378272 RepID=A0ACB8TZV6_9APHY|nr:hypothetical protein BDY19DRAFT_232987 [Irpex rosettiformis]
MDAPNSSPFAALESIIAAGQHDAMLARYFAMSGLVLIIWEYFLTLDQEITLIWRVKGFSLSSFVFRLSRYGLILSFICQSFAAVLVFCIVASALGTNSYLVMKHLQAWDGRREIYYVIITALLLTHIPGLVLAGLSMKGMYNSTTYVSFLNTCAVFTKTPTVIPAWTCVVAFDSVMIILSFLNALDRPRRRDADVMLYLRRDGAPFFLTVFALRYTGLVLLVRLPPTRYYLTIFLAWPMTSITLCRFILNGERLKARRQDLLLSPNPELIRDANVYELDKIDSKR